MPFVVFNAKPTGRIIREVNLPHLGYSPECYHTVQDKNWVDEDRMKLWIRKIWKPFVMQKREKYRDRRDLCFILQLDNFKAHLTQGVISELMKLSTLMVEVPASCTSNAQVLDVGINKPFKDRMDKLRTQWMLENPTGSVSRPLISTWIAAAWRSITEEAILNTCRHIGFFGNDD